jgi:hypothetical protein
MVCLKGKSIFENITQPYQILVLSVFFKLIEKIDYLSEEQIFYYSSRVAKRYFYILKYNQTRF